MPIKGVSTINDVDITSALPLFAKVKKGAEKPERGIGKDLDYFRFVFEPEFAELEEIFVKIYGECPRYIPEIKLPPVDVETAFPNWLQSFRSNHTLKVQCDGENQVLHWVDGQGFSRKPLPCQRHADGTCPLKCNERGYLYFIIPDFCAKVGKLGFFRLETSSPVDIKHISSVLYTTQQMYGAINATSYHLSRVEKSFTPVINGKPASVDKWMIQLVSNHDATAPAPRLTGSTASAAPALPATNPIEGEVVEDAAFEEMDVALQAELVTKLEEHSNRYLGLSLDTLLEGLQFESPADFVMAFPSWTQIAGRITDLIIEEQLPVRVYGVKTKQREDSEQVEYLLSFGFNLVRVYGREAFNKDTGLDARKDYFIVNEDGKEIARNISYVGNHSFEDVFGRAYLNVEIEKNGNGNLAVSRITDPLTTFPA